MKIGKRNIYNYIKTHFKVPKCYEMEYSHSKFMEILQSNEIKIIVTEEYIEVTTYIYIKKLDMKLRLNTYKRKNTILKEKKNKC